MREHALLSASSSHRWLACTPSARLEEKLENKTSRYAAEGRDAHKLAEYKLNKFLGKAGEKPVSEFDSQELEHYTNEYVEYVSELIAEAYNRDKSAIVLIEQRVEYGQWARKGFGTADAIIATAGRLNVIDFKYGRGKEVPVDDPQLKLYALGSVDLLNIIYDFKSARVTVYQPRINNIKTQELGIDKLLKWGDKEVKPKAELAYKGEGEYIAGEEQCRFCKARATCKARANYDLEMLKYEFKNPDLLTDEEIEEVLEIANSLKAWCQDIWAYASKKAINEGKKWGNFKLVEGRAYRRYTDENKVVEKLLATGKYKENQLFTKKLIGITAMEKLLKKDFNVILKGLVEKPKGRPLLVSETDKRPELKNSAELDFKKET